VVASGPEAALHARKIDSIYAPVDPMMRSAADAELLAQVDKSGGMGSRYISPEEKAALPPKYGTPVVIDAPAEVGPPPASLALPTGSPFQGLMINKRNQYAEVDKAIEDKKRAAAGVPAPVEESDIPYKAAPQRSQNKASVPSSDNWDMEKKGSQFLSEPTTPEAIAERAYIANEIAAAQTPTPPGPIEKLGPSVPVSRSGIMGPSGAVVSDAMAAQEALAKANAAVEGRALDRQGFVDNEIANVAQATRVAADRQSAMIERDLAAREKTEAVMNKLRDELNLAVDPNAAFNNKSTGSKIMAGIGAFLSGFGASLAGASPDKVSDMMDKMLADDQGKTGRITKKIEEAYKASGMLGEMADKKRAIVATQGLLQTQAILAKIDALKSANMTQLQRDKLTLVEKEQLANQAMYTRDLETQINGTVNYALAGGMKQKGGGGGSNTKALEEYRKEMGSRLANSVTLDNEILELPVEMDKEWANKLRAKGELITGILDEARRLKKKADEAGLAGRWDETPEGNALAFNMAQIAARISKLRDQGAQTSDEIKANSKVLARQGSKAFDTIFENIESEMNSLSKTMKNAGAVRVNRLCLKRKRTNSNQNQGRRMLCQKAKQKKLLSAMA